MERCSDQNRYSFLLLLIAGFSPVAAQAINGDGKSAHKTYRLSSYSSIEVYSSVRAYITNDTGMVVVEADNNILPLIKVKVKENTLVIKNDPIIWFNPKTAIKIYIPLGKINNIKNMGAADINTLNVQLSDPFIQIANIGSGKIKVGLICNELKVSGKGSADFDLSGKTKHAIIDLSGSGDMRAAGLLTEVVDLRLNGSCDAWVNCQTNLNFHIPLISSSTVYYQGNPQIKKNGMGGSIEKMVF